MELIEPSARFIESYRQALLEFERDGISGFWKFFGPTDDADAYVRKIKRYDHQGKTKDEIVPATVYWLVDGNEFIGHVSIRHELSPSLERQGGHIGYAVRPSKQRQGYGTKLLEMAIAKAREMGLASVLVTCDEHNAPSRKIIEKNGGELQREIELNGVKVLHFRIGL